MFWVQSLGQEDPLEEAMATHSNILAWKIPRTEQPDGLQSTGSPRAVHDRATKYVHTHTHTHTHTRLRNEATGVTTQTGLMIDFRKECEYCSGNT